MSKTCLWHGDWLIERQDKIEQRLAKRHLKAGGLVLFDLTSSCPGVGPADVRG